MTSESAADRFHETIIIAMYDDGGNTQLRSGSIPGTVHASHVTAHALLFIVYQ